MKISKKFNLNKNQHELDFIDIDYKKDTSLFIDPFHLSTRSDVWSVDASATIQSFFQFLISLVRTGNITQARSLLKHLNEPNETCLGLSKGKPRGNGVGSINAKMIFDSLLNSKAMKTGLVEDLEDSAIFIDNIDKDKVSDMTTNIIRKHLIEYTQNQCHLLNIPLRQNVPSGFFWDSSKKKWDNQYEEMLVVNGKKILLVPKIAVTFYKEYTTQKYHQHYVLNFLQNDHLENNTELVQTKTLKDGYVKRWVTKESIKEKENSYTKEFLLEFTIKHPEIFEKFRKETAKSTKPIENDLLEEINLNEFVGILINELKTIHSGKEAAGKYHSLILGILEFIFYPHLTNPRKERPINDGRKRIDITFDNASQNGFFRNLHEIKKIPCSYIMCECKNYSSDPANPELDQLMGRFSVNRGRFGLLLCRDIKNAKVLLARCQDIFKDRQEVIIVLTDKDLIDILNKKKEGVKDYESKLLEDKIREIILS